MWTILDFGPSQHPGLFFFISIYFWFTAVFGVIVHLSDSVLAKILAVKVLAFALFLKYFWFLYTLLKCAQALWLQNKLSPLFLAESNCRTFLTFFSYGPKNIVPEILWFDQTMQI